MGAALGDIATQAEISLKRRKDDELLVVLSGSWRLVSSLPSAEEIKGEIDPNQVHRIAFETGELKDWDSGLLTFLIKVNQFCFQNKIQFEAQDFPEEARRFLKLAAAVPERMDVREKPRKFYTSL